MLHTMTVQNNVINRQYTCLNSLSPSVAYTCQWIYSRLAIVITNTGIFFHFYFFNWTLKSEINLRNSYIFIHAEKWISECRLEKWTPFCLRINMLNVILHLTFPRRIYVPQLAINTPSFPPWTSLCPRCTRCDKNRILNCQAKIATGTHIFK